MSFQPLPGFRDFYPDDCALRNYVFGKWRDAARRYGFREYDGPPLEPLELYTVKSGDEIVGQLYNFTDKGKRAVSLRPELTPTFARMVGARQRDYKKPMKWFAIPQLFRYERQQRGRLREHFQFNADIVGEKDVAADAELVALLVDLLRSFGLTHEDFVVRVSDRRVWSGFLRGLGIAEEQHPAVFGIVDKIERDEPMVTQKKFDALGVSAGAASAILKFADTGTFEKEAPAEMATLQRFFDLMAHKGLGDFLKFDPKIVRGLAYYTGIVFEAFDKKGELRAIAGGGRYDNLLQLISGVDMPALGFGMGDVVLCELLKERNLLPKLENRLDAYVVIAKEELRPQALKLVRELREAGLACDYPLIGAKVGKQFEAASAGGAKFAVVIGDEWAQGQATVKTLATREENKVEVARLVERLKQG
ncbi:MAG: histidine--tRNA ligase [Verrucomicrobia bacterium]|nr:histidine--tRNA ligase [Verrucomicrobiota bacterium]